MRAIAQLRRVAVDEGYGESKTRRTLHFTLNTQYSLAGACDFVRPEDVPDFVGDIAWFEVEKVERGNGRPHAWWRAVRQIEPPPHA